MNFAVIPARGGSKSIPKKNLALVGGKSLLERAVNCAKEAGIERVYVSTDDGEIAKNATQLGAEVITRPSNLSGDNASSEAALLHAITQIDKKVCTLNSNLVFLQATSPFTNPKDVSDALDRVAPGKSLFSATEFHNFLWIKNGSHWFPSGHDSKVRKMKEELQETAMETGNFYCFPVKNFLEEESRFCGEVFPFFIDPLTTLQIDSPGELIAAQKIAALWNLV